MNTTFQTTNSNAFSIIWNNDGLFTDACMSLGLNELKEKGPWFYWLTKQRGPNERWRHLHNLIWYQTMLDGKYCNSKEIYETKYNLHNLTYRQNVLDRSIVILQSLLSSAVAVWKCWYEIKTISHPCWLFSSSYVKCSTIKNVGRNVSCSYWIINSCSLTSTSLIHHK